MTFKDRIADVAITQAQVYKSVFVDYEYLVCSQAFQINDYYILAAKGDNYQHLVGVNTPRLSPRDFFSKCLQGTLTAEDFDFQKKGREEKAVKGAVRKKIRALPYYTAMLTQPFVVQESFSKNSVLCSFAGTDCNMTIGYIAHKKAHPKSLMLGDAIDWTKAAPVDLILRRPAGAALFSELLLGTPKALSAYQPKLQGLLSPAPLLPVFSHP